MICEGLSVSDKVTAQGIMRDLDKLFERSVTENNKNNCIKPAVCNQLKHQRALFISNMGTLPHIEDQHVVNIVERFPDEINDIVQKINENLCIYGVDDMCQSVY